MDNTAIIIPLSKNGKNAGKYEAIVSIEDSDLAEINWHIAIRSRKGRTYYVRRVVRAGEQHVGFVVVMHRVILTRMLDRELERSEQVDHIDGDGLNNRRSNIRLATNSQNSMNKGILSNNQTGYKGVVRRKNGEYTAKITVNGKRTFLGTFDTAIEAYEAYCAAAKDLHGEFYNPG